jgi:hypothetical protein
MNFKEYLSEARTPNPDYTQQVKDAVKAGFKVDKASTGSGMYITNLFKDDMMLSIEAKLSSSGPPITLMVPLRHKLTNKIPASKRGNFEETNLEFKTIKDLKNFIGR